MDRRKKILVNQYEIATEQSLQRAVAKQNAIVRAKVRVADALAIEHSGLTNEEYSYALKAHFDFLVTDTGHTSLFAVEFDERHHLQDAETIKKDRLKNSICDKLEMPLLRIDKPYLKRVERFATVLDWLIEMWYMEQAWNSSYEAGQLDPDADFDPYLIFEWGYIDNGTFVPVNTATTSTDQLISLIKAGHKLSWRSYDPFVAYINTIRKLSHDGVCIDAVPEIVENLDWNSGYSTTLAYVRIRDKNFIGGEVRCRVSNFITGGIEIARNLAIVDCTRKLLEYRSGKVSALTFLELETLKQKMKS